MSTEAEKPDDEIEIEIVDDTPEPDRGRPKAEAQPAAEATDEADEDDDLTTHSDKVRKRINKLKYDFHAERRAKEEATRLREEAITVAAQLKADNDRYRRQIEAGDAAMLEQAKQRVASQLEQAKVAYKSAYEDGDANAVTDAQMRLTEVKAEEMRLASFRPARSAPQPAPAPQAPQAAPTVSAPSPQAMNWASQNPWFGTNEEMTGFAYGVHERVIKQGVAPDSEAYYNAIDTAVRRTFADKFDDGKTEDRAPRRQQSSVVAPAGRQTNVTPRRVVLSSTQVALAKRLGVTPQQYAAQLLKDSSNG